MTDWNDPEQRAKQMEWRRLNKNRLNASKRKYVEKNPEKVSKTKENYRENNREFLRESGRKHYRKKIEWFVSLKRGMSCFECGDFRIYVLEMHHIDPTEKRFEVCMTNVYKYSKEEMVVELEKTVPLCANCHAEIHHFDRELIRFLKGS